MPSLLCTFFFFNDTATTEIYTLSLHDALPIWRLRRQIVQGFHIASSGNEFVAMRNHSLGVGMSKSAGDRKSTRLNSSHSQISYAVFCLKKKNTSKTA